MMHLKGDRVKWIIFLSSTLTLMSLTAVASIVNEIRADLNLSTSLTGFIITLYALIVVLISPFIGKWIDRFGAKNLLVGGLFLYGTSGLMVLMENSLWVLILSRIIMGVGVAAIFSTITVIIGDVYSGSKLHHMMGLRVSINNIGAVVWPILGGLLGEISWQAPFAIFMVGFPLGFMVIKEVPKTHIGIAEATKDSKMSFFLVIRENPTLILIYLLMFLTTIIISVGAIFVPQLLKHIGVTNTVAIGFYISAMTLAVATTSFFYGRIMDNLRNYLIVVVAFSFWVLGFSLITFLPAATSIMIAVMALGIGRGMVFPATIVWASEVGPESERGIIVSTDTAFAYLGIFMAPVLLLPAEVYGGIFGVFGALTFFSIILLLAIIISGLVIKLSGRGDLRI